MMESNWQSLQQSADRARKSADHEKAVGLYTQALAQPACDTYWDRQFHQAGDRWLYRHSTTGFVYLCGRYCQSDRSPGGIHQGCA